MRRLTICFEPQSEPPYVVSYSILNQPWKLPFSTVSRTARPNRSQTRLTWSVDIQGDKGRLITSELRRKVLGNRSRSKCSGKVQSDMV